MSDLTTVGKAGGEELAKKAAEEFLKKLGIAGAGVALTLTDIVKKLVDEETQKKLHAIRCHEGCPHVHGCSEISGWVGSQINGMTAATLGWTAWQSPYGLWVFHHQHDYPPRSAQVIYRPVQKGGDKLWTWKIEYLKHGTGKICKRCKEAWAGR